MRLVIALVLGAACACAQVPTSLWVKGDPVIQTPRHVMLAEVGGVLDRSWTVDAGAAGEQGIAFRSLIGDLESFHSLTLRRAGRGENSIKFAVAAGTVRTGAEPEIDRQAYRLRIDAGGIEITGTQAGEP